MIEEADVATTYTLAGFGRRVGGGARPAVLVVDFSVGFTHPGAATGAEMSTEVAATAKLLGHARTGQIPVLFTTIAYDSAQDASRWWPKAEGLAGLVEGSPLAELDPRLEARADEKTLVKKGPSAFHGTELTSWLVRQDVDTVLVCGATTSGCVRATVVDAMQYGFRVLVPRECVGDRAPGPHLASLFDMDQKYADVIDLDTAIDYLRRTGSGSELPTTGRR